MQRIFISSVQKEFAAERAALADYLRTDQGKHPKMQALIQHASNQVIRRRFNTSANLHPAVYASLVNYLQAHELLRFTPFDASACRDATLADLSNEKIQSFLRTAHGLPEPTFGLTDGFVTTIWRKPELALAHVGGETPKMTQQVTEQVRQILKAAVGEKSRAELMAAVGLKARVNFSRNYLEPALAAGLIERTLPGSPNSPTQKYRPTAKGQRLQMRPDEV